MKQWFKENPTLSGFLFGVIIPLIITLVFLLTVQHRFDSFKESLIHFQQYNILYKILSLALMPGVAIFMLGIKRDWLRLSRGLLGGTLIWGLIIVILFMV